jgi:hypothetical protein
VISWFKILLSNATCTSYTLVFPIGDFQGGPPFALSPTIVESLLEPAGFERVSLTEVPHEQWARERPEFLYRWRRKAA